MSATGRQLVIPMYLILCLLLGGSAQGIWGNMVLQLLGVAIIAWALIEPPREPISRPACQLLWLAAAAILLVLAQLIPMPPSLWTQLGGRELIAQGYSILRMPLPALPVSLAPHRTIDALLAAIPPLAILLGVTRLKAFRAAYAAAAILAGTVAGIGLGALQVSGGSGGATHWYLYPVTNIGVAVGFFANANHMATLLLISLPFIAAMVRAARGSHIQRYSAFVAITAGLGLLVLIGIALNRSLAGYALVLPVLLGSSVIMIGRKRRLRTALSVLAGLMLVVAVGAIATTGIGRDRLGAEARVSTGSRAEILAPTIAITRDFLPLGSGLGSFRPVYAMHEDPDRVAPTYVVHAHNDYAEWAMEMGASGIVLMILFLGWWARAVVRVWSDGQASAFARAASIASAAVLAHSLVDFPLRTSAIAGCFAFCMALLADRRAPPVRNSGDLRPTRHIVVR